MSVRTYFTATIFAFVSTAFYESASAERLHARIVQDTDASHYVQTDNQR